MYYIQDPCIILRIIYHSQPWHEPLMGYTRPYLHNPAGSFNDLADVQIKTQYYAHIMVAGPQYNPSSAGV